MSQRLTAAVSLIRQAEAGLDPTHLRGLAAQIAMAHALIDIADSLRAMTAADRGDR